MSKPYVSNYDKYPVVPVSDARCDVGWNDVASRLKKKIRPGRFVIAVECYSGCNLGEIESNLSSVLRPQAVLCTEDCYLPESAITALTARDLGDDPVFAFMNNYELSELLDEGKLREKRRELESASGLVVVIGTGATLLAEEWDLLVYCDLARWEIQRRQRAGQIGNLGLHNFDERPALK